MGDVNVPFGALLTVILFGLAGIGKLAWDALRNHKPSSRPPPGCPLDARDLRDIHEVVTAKDRGRLLIYNKDEVEGAIMRTDTNMNAAVGLLKDIRDLLRSPPRDRKPTVPGGE